MNEVSVTPASGIKQAYLVSLAMFVMGSSVRVPIMKQISPSIHVLFCADDLFRYIPLRPSALCALLPQIFKHIRLYGVFVGLRLKLGKLAFLVKGMREQRHVHVLRTFVIQVKQNVKYFGVLVGYVSNDQAYAPLIARAVHRAHYVRTLPLTHDEHTAVFQESVLPLLILPALATFPNDIVVRNWPMCIRWHYASTIGA